MMIFHLALSVSLMLAVALVVGGALIGLLALLARLEPATVRITHPPTRPTRRG